MFFFYQQTWTLLSTLADRPDVQRTPSSPVEGDEHKPLNTPIVMHCFDSDISAVSTIDQTGLKYLISFIFSFL